jgi:DNA gyrase subunit A
MGMTYGHSETDVRNELRGAQDQVQVLEAIVVAVNDAHRVLDAVLKASGQAAARGALEQQYGFTEMQATAVLDMQFGRMNAIDVEGFEQRRQELTARVAALKAELGAP